MGQETELAVESLAAGGCGVARDRGLVWLVRGGIPGDRVRAVAERVRPRLVEARVGRLLSASDRRRPAPCPLQDRCGGCPWMPLPEAEQASWKARLVSDALHRIGRLENPPVAPIEPSPVVLGYRGKVEFSLGCDGSGARAIGLTRADGAGLIDVESCLLLPETAARVYGVFREVLSREPGFLPGPLWSTRPPHRLVLRHSRKTGKVLLALQGPPERFPSAGEWGRRVLALDPAIQGVVRIRTRGRRRGGARTEVLAGDPLLAEEIAGISFRLPATAFFQVNPAAAEVLVRLVRRAVAPRPRERILDLYGGVGLHGAVLASEGADATVVEADGAAVACGRRSAQERGVRGRLRFVRADVAAELRRRAAGGARVDAIVANPPRTGFGRGVAEGIAALRPERICIVSCDPPTLARDVARLDGLGYRAERVVPVDLFPQTAHVESVARLVPSR